jgi:glycosyltransferase involved in cell wall biosynthesis
MNVLMVNRFFWPHLGGVEFHILNLSRALRDLGCDVTVAYRRRTDEVEKRDFRGVKLKPVRHAYALSNVIDRSYDVVHGHMTRNLFACTGILRARARRVPSVFTPHCYYPARTPAIGFAKTMFDLGFTRATLRASNAVINLTPRDQEDSARRGMAAQKSHLIPNSVSLQELRNVELIDFATKYGVPRAFILHVGRFEAHKNIDFLVRMHGSLPRDLGLVLIGQDDGSRDSIRSLVEQLGLTRSVLFIDRASFQDVCSAYAQARATVMASSYEGLPTCLLEAMFFGCPVVSSAVGGVPFLLRDGINGFLFPRADGDGYCAAVRRAIERNADAIERAKDDVETKYSWEINAPRVLSLYRALRGTEVQ